MSIKQKLFTGFGFLILLCVLQGGFALKEVNELGQLCIRSPRVIRDRSGWV